MKNGPLPVCGGGQGGRGVRVWGAGQWEVWWPTKLTFEVGTASGTTLPNAGRHLFKYKLPLLDNHDAMLDLHNISAHTSNRQNSIH